MADDIETRVIATARTHLRYLEEGDELRVDAELDGLGLDSTAAMSLLMDLEDEFGVMFPESLLTEETFETPGSLADGIRKLL